MPRRMTRRSVLLLAVAALLGAGGRLWLCSLAPTVGYPWDHFDTIGMGHNAARLGLLHIYSAEFEDLAPITGQLADGRTIERRPVVLPNYPPLAILSFRLQVAALEALDPPLRANTRTARLVMGGVPFLFELVAAYGLLRIGRRVASERQGVVAAALLWCFPPVAMNSTLWGQVDAFLLAPAVLSCLWMIERRWALSGACLAVAALLKPQGVILAPMALYGAVVLAGEERAAPTQREVLRRLGSMVSTAVGVVLCVGLPWMVVDGLAWVRRCFVQSFFEAFPDTTLFAFNVWYLDALRDDGELRFALDSTARVLGLSKDAWGRILLSGALAASAALAWRRYRREPVGLVIFSGLWLWSVFLWPTRVHERFILYCMPFVILAAAVSRPFRPVLLGLLLVGVAEHSWNQWLQGPPAGTLVPRRSSIALQHRAMTDALREDERSEAPSLRDLEEQHLKSAASRIAGYREARASVRPLEIALTAVSLLSYLGALLASGHRPRERPRGRGKGERQPRRVAR